MSPGASIFLGSRASAQERASDVGILYTFEGPAATTRPVYNSLIQAEKSLGRVCPVPPSSFSEQDRGVEIAYSSPATA